MIQAVVLFDFCGTVRTSVSIPPAPDFSVAIPDFSTVFFTMGMIVFGTGVERGPCMQYARGGGSQVSLVEDLVYGKNFQPFLQDVFSGDFVHLTMPEIQATPSGTAPVAVHLQ